MKGMFIRVIGLIPLLIGLFLVQLGGRNILEANQTSGWLSAEGKILSSKVGTSSPVGTSRKNPVPIPKVEYTYEVDGVPYTSSRISHNVYGSNIKGQVQGIIDRYPQGAAVTVFYDPAKPSSAVLEKKAPVMHYLVVGGGAIFLLIGYFLVFKAPKYFNL